MRALPVVFGDVYTRQYARTVFHEDGALYHTVIGLAVDEQDGAAVETLPPDTAMTAPVAR